jgi:hypothetical protein
MSQTRYIIAKTIKPHTKEQWREIWLEKLGKSCAAVNQYMHWLKKNAFGKRRAGDQKISTAFE